MNVLKKYFKKHIFHLLFIQYLGSKLFLIE